MESRDGAGVAVLVHGAGSTPDVVCRLLSAAVPPGTKAVAVAYAGGVDQAVEAIDAAVTAYRSRGCEVALLAGISLGAHAVARWSVERGSDVPCGLVMPAWTGEPDDVAHLNAATAREVERVGVGQVLDRVRREAPGDWVVDELASAWSSLGARDLVVALDAAAASAAPTLEELSRLRAPTCVVALRDDPLHPLAVAEAWAGAIPGAVLREVDRDAPARERPSLGTALADGLESWRLSGSR